MKQDYLQIRNNCLLYYSLPLFRGKQKDPVFKVKAYSGKVTNGAKKRLQKAIDILVQKSPWRSVYNPISFKTIRFRLNFLTLTISSDKVLNGDEGYKNLMKPFLRIMRKRHKFSYVWKAEFQGDTDYYGKEKKYGGQLHYHIASNQFIAWTEIRRVWNNLQRKNGYLKKYAMKYKSYDPNSVDVHSVYKVNDLAAYLGKYMSKDQKKNKGNEDSKNGLKFKGKVWDCSKDLKQNRFAFTPTYRQELKIREGVRKGQIKQINLEHCTIFKTTNPIRYLTTTQYRNYDNWKKGIINHQPKIFKMKEKKEEQLPSTTEMKMKQKHMQRRYFNLTAKIMEFATLGEEMNKQIMESKRWSLKREMEELAIKIKVKQQLDDDEKNQISAQDMFRQKNIRSVSQANHRLTGTIFKNGNSNDD